MLSQYNNNDQTTAINHRLENITHTHTPNPMMAYIHTGASIFAQTQTEKKEMFNCCKLVGDEIVWIPFDDEDFAIGKHLSQKII